MEVGEDTKIIELYCIMQLHQATLKWIKSEQVGHGRLTESTQWPDWQPANGTHIVRSNDWPKDTLSNECNDRKTPAGVDYILYYKMHFIVTS